MIHTYLVNLKGYIFVVGEWDKVMTRKENEDNLRYNEH